jgi:hypothetical protein
MSEEFEAWLESMGLMSIALKNRARMEGMYEAFKAGQEAERAALRKALDDIQERNNLVGKSTDGAIVLDIIRCHLDIMDKHGR